MSSVAQRQWRRMAARTHLIPCCSAGLTRPTAICRGRACSPSRRARWPSSRQQIVLEMDGVEGDVEPAPARGRQAVVTTSKSPRYEAMERNRASVGVHHRRRGAVLPRQRREEGARRLVHAGRHGPDRRFLGPLIVAIGLPARTPGRGGRPYAQLPTRASPGHGWKATTAQVWPPGGKAMSMLYDAEAPAPEPSRPTTRREGRPRGRARARPC